MSNEKHPRAGFGVMLLRDGKVLLGRRHEDPDKADSELDGAGTWTLPGGKLDFGESFEVGASREVLEETGIRIDSTRLKLVSVSNDIGKSAHFVSLGWLCEDFTGEPEVCEPDEITEWKWFGLDDLPSPLFFPSEKVINNYLVGEIYTLG